MALLPSFRSVTFVFCVALALRLCYFGIIGVDSSLLVAPDSIVYQEIARGILEFGQYVRLNSAGSFTIETERVPVYALYLIPFIRLLGDSILMPILGQIFLGSVTCVMIGFMANEIEEGAFLPAGMLSAACLNMIAHDSIILTESVFLFFFVLHLWTAARFLNKASLVTGSLSGMFLGLAIMTKTVAVYWLPVYAGLVVLVSLYRGNSFKNSSVRGAFVLLCGVFIIFPQYARNYLQFGHWQLTSQNGSAVLGWYVPLVMEFSSGIPWEKGGKIMRDSLAIEIKERGLSDIDTNPFSLSQLSVEVGYRALMALGPAAIIRGWATGAMINFLTPSMASVSFVEKMDRPRFYQTQGENIFKKVLNFIFHRENRLYLGLMLPAMMITMGLKAVFIFGVWSAVKRKQPTAFLVMLLLSIGYFLIVTGPLVNASRYRIPMEPAIIVFTVIGWMHTLERRRKK